MREVARAHQRVLVDQEPHDRDPAEPVEEPEPREPAEQREGHGGERVVQARRRERGGDAEARGDGVEPLRAVHLDVLAGVDQVESRDPHRQREPEEERGRLERPADGDPAAGRRHPVREPEDPVRRPREALGVGVADQEDERERRQGDAQRVQHRRRDEQERGPHRREELELADA